MSSSHEGSGGKGHDPATRLRQLRFKHYRQFSRDFNKALKMELRQNRKSFITFNILRVLVILVMIRTFINGNFESFALCILTLILLVVPAFIETRLRVEIPQTLEITLYLFIFSAEILGEVSDFYTIFPYWDTLLHTLNGFIAAGIGLSLAWLLNANEKITFDLSPLFLAIVAFCFSMTIGVLWEFFEFSMDYWFGFDMQKDTVIHAFSSVMLDPTGSQNPVRLDGITDVTVNGQDLGLGGYLDIGIIDTMGDLFVNFIGALVFSIIGFLALKRDIRKSSIAENWVISRKSADQDFLERVTKGDKDLKNMNDEFFELSGERMPEEVWLERSTFRSRNVDGEMVPMPGSDKG